MLRFQRPLHGLRSDGLRSVGAVVLQKDQICLQVYVRVYIKTRSVKRPMFCLAADVATNVAGRDVLAAGPGYGMVSSVPTKSRFGLVKKGLAWRISSQRLPVP